jgi:hypothetical protein
MKIINGYPEIEIYGLKIRASEDQRLEIDVKERGNTVDRIYIEFDFDNGCVLVYTHKGELNEGLPFDVSSLVASSLGKKGGSTKSDAKKKSSAENLANARAEGKIGGWPKGKPRKAQDKSE